MQEWINKTVLELRPYQPGKPLEEFKREFKIEKVIKLGSNENPFPLPQHVSDAITREISSLRLYPDTDSHFLRKRIAELNGVGLGNVIMGSGSVELIRMIVKTYLKPGEKVLTGVSTFPMFKVAAIENGGMQAIVEADMDEGYGFDLERLYRMADKKTKIIFIPNPNNPTGTMLSKIKLLDFIDSISKETIIVLDNAYQEYVSNPEDYVDGIELVLNRKNVIVLRTFSKIYALAGLRIGYGIANEESIGYLNRVKAPFNMTRVAQEAALASLENDDFKKQSLDLNNKNKEALFNQLNELGVNPVPSAANFILFFPGKDINEVNQSLLKEGVIIRPLQPFGVPNGMRVTVGFEEENNFFIEKLKKCLS
jgi:histidinol-phosphate aminotransferase